MRRIARGAKLVVATHNSGKLREIADLLRPFGVVSTAAGDLDLPEPEETETTFAGNAKLKARAAAEPTGLPALADDSGLSVEALGGAPGIYSARWAETPNGRDFGHAMHKVWTVLDAQQVPAPRRAAFVCALALVWPDGEAAVFEGRVEGQLVWPPRGDRGFGYDPMFLPDGQTQTFGEMAPAAKHAISHRARAFSALLATCLDPTG
ncbi:MAG: RdgB/HAM1 family non-canonical purine NTP pyrophosphatase [Pikeienuella sp.]